MDIHPTTTTSGSQVHHSVGTPIWGSSPLGTMRAHVGRGCVDMQGIHNTPHLEYPEATRSSWVGSASGRHLGSRCVHLGAPHLHHPLGGVYPLYGHIVGYRGDVEDVEDMHLSRRWISCAQPRGCRGSRGSRGCHDVVASSSTTYSCTPAHRRVVVHYTLYRGGM